MRAAKDGVGRAAALASRGLGSSATNHRPRHVWLTRQTTATIDTAQDDSVYSNQT